MHAPERGGFRLLLTTHQDWWSSYTVIANSET